ncbi:MAG: hypothetical protein IJ053_07250 [Lachnospiraceae bacterium]|nr:hypothetical protein [Lachnospiraceae bacterium]
MKKIKILSYIALFSLIISLFFTLFEGVSKADAPQVDFNVYAYANRYEDLQKVYKENLAGYEEHYNKYGKKEGRNAGAYPGNDERNSKLLFVYISRINNGVDYTAVFDPIYYLNTYSDIQKAFGDDQQKAFAHFLNYGMKEGRRGNADFNVYAYANRYTDLQKTFGNNLPLYYRHYAQFGKRENRNCSAYAGSDIRNSKLNFTYVNRVVNGVDYSAGFDAIYYLNTYSDLKKAYGDNQQKAFDHFLNYGIKEGRRGTADFNVYSYANNYTDLQKAYGTNISSYYNHYLKYGIKEGRTASGNDTKFNFINSRTSVKNYLKEALSPVGTTLYVYGGGWNEADTGTGTEAMSYGVNPNWKAFFDKNDSSYNYKNTMYQIHNGLDCSGYVGFVTYQVFGNTYSNRGYVYKSTNVVDQYSKMFNSAYINRYNINRYYPGDIMGTNGHVFIAIGKCSDGRLLFMHASPPVVSLCGTPTPSGDTDSEAVNLAKEYMRKYYRESYARYNSFMRPTSFLTDYNQMHWNRSVLSDPDGYDNMTPREILQDLFNE